MSAIPEHLRPPQYRVRCRCLLCGTEYSYLTTKISGPDRPCRRKACKEASAAAERGRMEANIRAMIESGQAPGRIGNNNAVKALDETQKIVAADYGLSDLKDNTREGEPMAPRLPPHQQVRADNFFGGGRRQRNNPMANEMNLIAARAKAGSYAPQPGGHIVDHALSPTVGPKLRPPIKIVAG